MMNPVDVPAEALTGTWIAHDDGLSDPPPAEPAVQPAASDFQLGTSPQPTASTPGSSCDGSGALQDCDADQRSYGLASSLARRCGRRRFFTSQSRLKMSSSSTPSGAAGSPTPARLTPRAERRSPPKHGAAGHPKRMGQYHVVAAVRAAGNLAGAVIRSHRRDVAEPDVLDGSGCPDWVGTTMANMITNTFTATCPYHLCSR